MTPSGRESQVTAAFVSLARTLATGYDVVDLLTTLTAECASLLDIASAGLLLADPGGTLHVLAASSERTRLLELFQLQGASGPCLECYRTGQPVLVPDLPAEADRWPRFATAARIAGFASIHALPLSLADQVLGTLGLFGTAVGPLNEPDLSLGQSLADVAAVALIQDAAASDAAARNAQLLHALSSRVVIEQAKGVLAQTGNLEMSAAFNALRRWARDHNRHLTDIADDVVARTLPARTVLEHYGAQADVAPPPGSTP